MILKIGLSKIPGKVNNLCTIYPHLELEATFGDAEDWSKPYIELELCCSA